MKGGFLLYRFMTHLREGEIKSVEMTGSNCPLWSSTGQALWEPRARQGCQGVLQAPSLQVEDMEAQRGDHPKVSGLASGFTGTQSCGSGYKRHAGPNPTPPCCLFSPARGPREPMLPDLILFLPTANVHCGCRVKYFYCMSKGKGC